MIPFDPVTIGTMAILASANPASLCKMPQPTQINVIPRSEPVKYDYSQTLDQLQAKQIDTINPYGFDTQSHTAGYMQGSVSLLSEVKLGQQYFPRYNVYCLWYDTVTLKIEIDPTIVIAKEKTQNKCEFNAIKEHELKHVKVDRQIVNKYSGTMGRIVYDGLKSRGFLVGPIPAKNVREVAARMQQTVGQLLDLEKQKMSIERIELQQGVDSLEEYQRVNTLCDGTTGASRSRRR